MNISRIIDFEVSNYDEVENLVPVSLFNNIKKYFTYLSHLQNKIDNEGFTLFLYEVLREDKHLLQNQQVLAILTALFFSGVLIITDKNKSFVIKNGELFLPVLSHTDISYDILDLKDIKNSLSISYKIPYKLLCLSSLYTSMGYSSFNWDNIDIFKKIFKRRIYDSGAVNNSYLKKVLNLFSDDKSTNGKIEKELKRIKKLYISHSITDKNKDIDLLVAYYFLSVVIFESNLLSIKKQYYDYIGEEPSLNDLYRVVWVNFYTSHPSLFDKKDILIDMLNRMKKIFSTKYNTIMDYSSAASFIRDLRFSSSFNSLINILFDLLDITYARLPYMFILYVIYRQWENVSHQLIAKFLNKIFLQSPSFLIASSLAQELDEKSFINYYLKYLKELNIYTGDLKIDEINIKRVRTQLNPKKDNLILLFKEMSSFLINYTHYKEINLFIEESLSVFYNIAIENNLEYIMVNHINNNVLFDSILGIFSVLFNGSIYYSVDFNIIFSDIYKSFQENVSLINMATTPDEKVLQVNLLYNNNDILFIDDKGGLNIVLNKYFKYNFYMLDYTFQTFNKENG